MRLESEALTSSPSMMASASAVLRAVSARPLRAPWDEMKYSSTERPSRKDAVIGRSMMLPDGSAMRPRMPASWRIWSFEPRALESTIM